MAPAARPPRVDSYILMLTGAGALILLVAWLPMVLKPLSVPLSLPMICVALGALLFSASSGAMPDPRDFPRLAEFPPAVIDKNDLSQNSFKEWKRRISNELKRNYINSL